jgi:hypothetical protein
MEGLFLYILFNEKGGFVTTLGLFRKLEKDLIYYGDTEERGVKKKTEKKNQTKRLIK